MGVEPSPVGIWALGDFILSSHVLEHWATIERAAWLDTSIRDR